MSDWVLVEGLYRNYINLDRVNYIQYAAGTVSVYFAGQEHPLELDEESASKLLSGKKVYNG